jgi:diguanylate cyclase (GGDEF)-like protein
MPGAGSDSTGAHQERKFRRARLLRSRRIGADASLLLAYGACLAIEFALLPLDSVKRWSEVAPALSLQLLVGVLLAAGPRRSLFRTGWIGVTGVIAYLVSVGLLRDGAGQTAGFGPLVLLPVVWASLNALRREFVVAVIGVAVVYLVPAFAIGPPQYPKGSWHSGLLFAVISGVLGGAVIALVGRVNGLVDQLELLARSDDLTGLPNRRAWQELLEHEVAIARRTGQPLAVALLDLDAFKAYNDEHGHLAGDRLLHRAAGAWKLVLRETDVLARWGGDEFGVLLPGCDRGQAEALVDRMRASCREVPFSAGFAEWDRAGEPESILARADVDLYRVKATRIASLDVGAHGGGPVEPIAH